MTNRQIFQAIEGHTCARIERMFFLAASADSSALEEFLKEDLVDINIEQLFPKVSLEEFNEAIDWRQDVAGVFLSSGYYGFVAEVFTPERSDFRFKEGTDEYISCSAHPGIMSMDYIYFESISEIPAMLKKIDDEKLARDIAYFRKKQSEKEKEV